MTDKLTPEQLKQIARDNGIINDAGIALIKPSKEKFVPIDEKRDFSEDPIYPLWNASLGHTFIAQSYSSVNDTDFKSGKGFPFDIHFKNIPIASTYSGFALTGYGDVNTFSRNFVNYGIGVGASKTFDFPKSVHDQKLMLSAGISHNWDSWDNKFFGIPGRNNVQMTAESWGTGIAHYNAIDLGAMYINDDLSFQAGVKLPLKSSVSFHNLKTVHYNGVGEGFDDNSVKVSFTPNYFLEASYKVTDVKGGDIYLNLGVQGLFKTPEVFVKNVGRGPDEYGNFPIRDYENTYLYKDGGFKPGINLGLKFILNNEKSR